MSVDNEENKELKNYLSTLSRLNGQAALDDSIASAFRGINISGRNARINTNTENHGYTFFTRPTMNMSTENLQVDRVLSNLLRDEPWSVQRMIRGYFDHQLVKRVNEDKNELVLGKFPGIDNRNPFIPLLSNNLISLSGWPDFTLNTNTSQPGVYREAYSYVDDVPYNYETFDLQASFRNLSGDPISFMLLMWGWYMGLVYEGRIMPYPENVLNNRVDYNTRIYRLVMDQSRRFVTRIGAVGAAFPMTAPIGNIFNFEGDGSETPFSTANDQITANFRCMGFTYYDHILVWEFNRTVQITCDEIRPNRNGERPGWTKLRENEKQFFNYRALPQINEYTMELEWWITNDDYVKYGGTLRPGAFASPADARAAEQREREQDPLLNQAQRAASRFIDN